MTHLYYLMHLNLVALVWISSNINYDIKSIHVENPGAKLKKKRHGLDLQGTLIIQHH